MENKRDMESIMNKINPRNLHIQPADMQTALEQFGDVVMLEVYKQIRSKSQRLSYLMSAYFNSRPADGEVPRGHPLYKLYCKLLANNRMLGELQLKYVQIYNHYADQYKLPRY